MFQCFNVTCGGARGNVRSCGTSRAHSACDTQDTLLWGHMALIRTPGIPWLMRSLVSCDNPYPLLSPENTRISKNNNKTPWGAFAKDIAHRKRFETQDLRQGKVGSGCNDNLKKWEAEREEMEEGGKRLHQQPARTNLNTKVAGDEKINLSDSTNPHLKTGTNEVFKRREKGM